ncbi:MAG: oxidoreductase [Polyangiaceae bacterium UTPRO1]|jgi:FAD-linked oxidoreductase|nr:FAD-binding protein [Myxococcales bacterium]OQY65056.1 MAG: oxidoreductase [Polyangiaceae bacterium UTPRO1]
MIARRTLLKAAAVVGAGLAGPGCRRDAEPPSPPVQDAAGHLVWRNWSGQLHSYPASRAAPASDAEVAALLADAPAPIRPVGAGHSFTALVPTDGTLVTLDGLAGMVAHDPERLQATVRAGTRLGDLGPALAAVGQEMPNLPDINKQSLAGALATGTHGTGRAYPALHGGVVGFRIATPADGLVDCDAVRNSELYQAARVGLGAFGVLTQVTLHNAPLTRVKKRVEPRRLEEVLEEWPRLVAAHRNVEFFALPFTGLAATITVDEAAEPVRPRGPDEDADILMELKRLRDWTAWAPALRRWIAQRVLAAGFEPAEAVDEGWKLLSNERPIRFNEMEYHVPFEVQVPALREVVAAIEARRPDVFFPVEARVIAADDAWLSPFHGRLSGSIAVHAYYKDDYRFFFDLVEPILRRYEGRPHWGKMHSLKAADLARLYPRFEDARRVRARVDPAGRMLNPYLRELLGA